MVSENDSPVEEAIGGEENQMAVESDDRMSDDPGVLGASALESAILAGQFYISILDSKGDAVETIGVGEASNDVTEGRSYNGNSLR